MIFLQCYSKTKSQKPIKNYCWEPEYQFYNEQI